MSNVNQEVNARLWQRLNALVIYLNRHLATQAKCERAIRRRGPAYSYLTYLHPPNVRLLNAMIKKAVGFQDRLKRDGSGKVTVTQARNMLSGLVDQYDKVDLDTDYRYHYQHALNMGRLRQTLNARFWKQAEEGVSTSSKRRK